MTELCIRCGALPATDSGWPHCDDCYQLACNEAHEAECEMWDAERDAERRTRRAFVPLTRTIPDLLLRVVRPRVPSLYLERNGIYRGDCPWCDEDGELAKSLFVYPTNLYHCFACEATGDAIQFLMSSEGLRFMQAVEWLADSTHYALQTTKPPVLESPRACVSTKRQLGICEKEQDVRLLFRTASTAAQVELCHE